MQKGPLDVGVCWFEYSCVRGRGGFQLAVPPLPTLMVVPPIPALVVVLLILAPLIPLIFLDEFLGTLTFVPVALPLTDVTEVFIVVDMEVLMFPR